MRSVQDILKDMKRIIGAKKVSELYVLGSTKTRLFQPEIVFGQENRMNLSLAMQLGVYFQAPSVYESDLTRNDIQIDPSNKITATGKLYNKEPRTVNPLPVITPDDMMDLETITSYCSTDFTAF